MTLLLSEIGIPHASVQPTGNSPLPLLPAAWDPLCHTSFVEAISPAARVRFNRIFTCAFHEQIAFLESTLSTHLLQPLLADPRFASEHATLQAFHDQEMRHSRAFHLWNRHMEPDLYRGHGDGARFQRASAWQLRALARMARGIHQWPWLLWFIILQEERGLTVARRLDAGSDAIDPGMRALHRWHLRDEEEHLACDEMLIERIWARAPSWRRRLNGVILLKLLREFYCAPKRAGGRVVDAWVAEHPEYRHLRAGLRREFAQLGTHRDYLRHNYGPEMIGATLTLMGPWPEFDGLRRWIDSFSTGGTHE